MHTYVSSTTRPSRSPTLLELYNEAPTSPRFLRKIQRRATLDIVARIVPESNRLFLSGSSINMVSPNVGPKTVVEMRVSEALLRSGISILFQPIHFYIREMNRIISPDIGTNIRIREKGPNDLVERNKILMIETKGFEHIRGKEIHGNPARRKIARQKELQKLRKMQIMHQQNPRIFLVLIADMKLAKFKQEFDVTNMHSVCDKYIEMPYTFDRYASNSEANRNMSELKGVMKDLRRLPGARLVRDTGFWYGQFGEIIKEQLMKIVG